MLHSLSDLEKEIEQAERNVAHAERRGNFDSAHHQVLANLKKQLAEQTAAKGVKEHAK